MKPELPIPAMPDSLSILLLIVFAIHLVVFSALYYKNRENIHLLFVLVFVLLILSHTLLMAGSEHQLFGYALHTCLRIGAWATTAAAIILFVRKKFQP